MVKFRQKFLGSGQVPAKKKPVFLCYLHSIYSRNCSLARILCCVETIVAVELAETIAGTARLWMPRSEWASSSSFQPVNADSLVNNPPCVEAVLYRWRVKSLVRIRRLLPGNQYRLLHIEHLDRLASRVNYCARRFSCESVITLAMPLKRRSLPPPPPPQKL